MFSVSHASTLTRVRATSNNKLSAAAIAVVEVNPDKPDAFLFSWLVVAVSLILFMSSYTSQSFALPAFQTRTAMNNAIYQNALIEVTPMLFHHIELGMNYKAVLETVGKSALYCDSGESACNANNGSISHDCLRAEFIEPNKTWMCHWDGNRNRQGKASNLQVWFLGDSVTHVNASMPNGMTYRRDSGNTIHLEKTQSS